MIIGKLIKLASKKVKNGLLTLTLIHCAFSASPLFAQFYFINEQKIPIIENNDTLLNAWAGGLNFAQFSNIDYDFDGDQDLFLFDRNNNNIRVFKNELTSSGRKYIFDYEASFLFPENLDHTTILVDYDGDGKIDLFTHSNGGLAIYKNIGDNVTGLKWAKIADPINSQYPFGLSNLYVGTDDIPAIIDVDKDGDIDILAFSITEDNVHYHQNQSMELYGVPDSIIFELKNECWGRFTKNTITDVIILNDPNSPCGDGGNITNPLKTKPIPGDSPKHSGSTLLALDMNNSGVLDLLFGDASNDFLILLMNGGSAPNTNSAMVSSSTDFPANSVAVEMPEFPGAFFVDVDFDGTKDLIVTPSARHDSENDQSILMYKNTGTNNLPDFSLVEYDFLQNTMIDIGSGSIPVFSDINDDGLPDLFVANFYRFDSATQEQSAISYYENVGTSNAPVFSLITDDFLNLSSQGYGLRMVPTFGDIDNDGDNDFFLGLADGTLAYYENHSTGSGYVFGSSILNYMDENNLIIDAGTFSSPQLFDLDGDGLLDLIIGKNTGELLYYKNTGTMNSPSFQLLNDTLGNIDMSPIFLDNYTMPHFFRLNDTTHLFLGTKNGGMTHYVGIDNNLSYGSSFTLDASNNSRTLSEGLSSFYVIDIDMDGKMDLFSGSDLGGVMHFINKPEELKIEKLSSSIVVSVYPNPTTNSFNLQIFPYFDANLTILNLNGQILKKQTLLKEHTEIDISDFNDGIYFLKVQTNHGELIVKKIIKHQL